MKNYSNISIIIPSLKPTYRLERTVRELVEAGFDDIVVVNDGSDAHYDDIFSGVGSLPECTLLTHDTNKGKGAALKTGFSFCAQNRPGNAGVITVDSDGQHLTADIAKCADALLSESVSGGARDFAVMGVRNLRQSNVPLHNAIGNRVTAFAMRVLFGLKLHDTQTGLRGIPAQLLPLLLEIEGSRFEYETNMLLEFQRLNIPFIEVSIEAVYEEGSNERSNFKPFRDSILIFMRIAKYSLSSVCGFLVDISLFSLSMALLGGYLGAWRIPVCTVIARLFSSFLNFSLNKMVVFKSKQSFGRDLARYYTLAAVQMLVSAGGLWLLSLPLSSMDGIWFITLLKVIFDAALFFISYIIQRSWVFR